MRYERAITALLVCSVLAGCATTPMGPTVQVMPGPDKPWDDFQMDQAACKAYASDQVQGQANAANSQTAGSAVAGAVLGALIGAAVGGKRSAAIGGAYGAAVGTAAGASQAQNTQLTIQQQYDNAYMQCMYAKGNQLP